MASSSARTSTTSTQSTNVSEMNLQDTGGITVADNKGSTDLTYAPVTVSTDDGAVSAGAAVAQAAINSNTDVSSAAINLGSQALSSGAQVANAGLDAASAAMESGLTFGTTALSTVQSLASEFSTQQEQLVASALSGYQTIAAQNSASDSTQIQKIALYAIGALVLVLVLPKVFK